MNQKRTGQCSHKQPQTTKNSMGIRHLNRFLKENASKSINLCKLSELSGKKIAVDISIYLYRFASENNLIENIYLMISIFRHYNIIPVFVFDGKPPPEKRELLEKRKQDKQIAEYEYLQLKTSLSNNDLDESDKQEMVAQMDALKKKFVTVNATDIENVKYLINYCGVTYYDAQGEADELCAMLTIKEKVWACLSEDMDMFVYGCPRVIRYLSLLHHTAVVYDVTNILSNLGITQKELREICVLSGTDYNVDNTRHNSLSNVLKLFKKYHKLQLNISFYEWLREHYKNVIQNYDSLSKIYNMFDLNQRFADLKVIETMKIENGSVMKDELQIILQKDGFLFP